MSDLKPRQHNTLDSLLTAALIKEHPDWDMETVREAALICSNTLLPMVKDLRISELEHVKHIITAHWKTNDMLDAINKTIDQIRKEQ